MPTKPMPMRFPVDLLERLDRYVEHMNRETPGLGMNRTRAVIIALTKFLNEFEAKPQPRRK